MHSVNFTMMLMLALLSIFIIMAVAAPAGEPAHTRSDISAVSVAFFF